MSLMFKRFYLNT